MDGRKLGLRVYATAADYRVAFGLAGGLIEQVSAIAPVRECRVYPYRKFEDQFGLWLAFAAPDQGAAFQRLSQMLAPQWVAEDTAPDRCLIWNQETDGGTAALPEATWMNLELWGEAGD